MQNLPLAWSVARRDPALPVNITPHSLVVRFSPLACSIVHLGTPPLQPLFFCHPEEANSLTMAPIAQAVTVSLDDLKKGT